LQLLEKETILSFFFKIKKLKSCIIPKYIVVNTIFCLDITSYPQAENQPHILALSVFSDTQIQRFKTKRAKIFPTPENYVF